MKDQIGKERKKQGPQNAVTVPSRRDLRRRLFMVF